MSDTRGRLRVGVMQVAPAGYRPSPMFEDSWAVCPMEGCDQGDGRPFNERDESMWFDYAASYWRCRNGHRADERFVLVEIQGRS